MKRPLRVYTPFMDLLLETDSYVSLQYNQKFYGIGDFELHVNQYVEGAEHFKKNNIIMLDKDPNKVMIIKHREISLDESGMAGENWKITGLSIEGVLGQRVTIPPAHTSHDRKSGSAETVMKHYVDRHFVNPSDPSRKIDYIEIAPDKKRGKYVKWESRFKNVADEISDISKAGNLGFYMYADMVRKKWIFDVIEPRDLTQDNVEGNPPVFFSPDFTTIKSQTFVDSDSNYRNVAYVGGQGEGVDRKIVKIGNESGIDLYEEFIDARDIGNETESEDGEEKELTEEELEQLLIERGKEKLKDFETIFYLEAQILTPTHAERQSRFAVVTPFEYETDFRLGDVVQVFNKKWGLTMDAPITEIKEIHEANGFVLEATFGEAQPTLIEKIRNEFDELKGIEKQEIPAKLVVDQFDKASEYVDERISAEEQARIEQAYKNLETAKKFTEEYAEKKRALSPVEPEDKSVIWIDNSDEENVIWKVWDGNAWVEGPGGPEGPKGEDGYTPIKGVDYFDGEDGQDGKDGSNAYLWVRYSQTSDGRDMTTDPSGAKYIGIATTTTSSAPTNSSAYQWALIKGADGVRGETGADGKTSYLHIKYSNDGGATFTSNNGETVGTWIGTYVDFNQTDSTNVKDYTWNKVKGDKGDKGATGPAGPTGPAGKDGKDGKDGIAHMGTTAPSNPATNATWFQTDSSGKVIAIKKWTGSAWTTAKMDSAVLNVGTLSAISADLGNVTAGNIKGVSINGSTFSAGFIGEGSTPYGTMLLDNESLAFHMSSSDGTMYGDRHSTMTYDRKGIEYYWEQGGIGNIKGRVSHKEIEYDGNPGGMNLGWGYMYIGIGRNLGADSNPNLDIVNTRSVDIPADQGFINLGSHEDVRMINTNGWGRFGARSSSYFHMDTDRPSFYMYKPLVMGKGLTSKGVTNVDNQLRIKHDAEHIRLTETKDDLNKTWHIEISKGEFQVVETGKAVHFRVHQGGGVRAGGTLDVQLGADVGNSITFNGKKGRVTYASSYTYIQTAGTEVRASKYAGTTLVPMRASSHPTSSSLLTKTKMEEFTKDEAYFLLDNAKIYKYHLKGNVEDGIYDKQKIGMMSQMVPAELRDEDGIDPYSVVSALWKVVQEQQKEIKKLQQDSEDIFNILAVL